MTLTVFREGGQGENAAFAAIESGAPSDGRTACLFEEDIENMIKIVTADGTAEREFLAQLRERSGETDKKVTEIVTAMLEDIKARGDEAVKEYTARFDNENPEFYEVPREVIESA